MGESVREEGQKEGGHRELTSPVHACCLLLGSYIQWERGAVICIRCVVCLLTPLTVQPASWSTAEIPVPCT